MGGACTSLLDDKDFACCPVSDVALDHQGGVKLSHRLSACGSLMQCNKQTSKLAVAQGRLV